jgi:hypothetical protein
LGHRLEPVGPYQFRVFRRFGLEIAGRKPLRVALLSSRCDIRHDSVANDIIGMQRRVLPHRGDVLLEHIEQGGHADDIRDRRNLSVLLEIDVDLLECHLAPLAGRDTLGQFDDIRRRRFDLPEVADALDAPVPRQIAPLGELSHDKQLHGVLEQLLAEIPLVGIG